MKFKELFKINVSRESKYNFIVPECCSPLFNYLDKNFGSDFTESLFTIPVPYFEDIPF